MGIKLNEMEKIIIEECRNGFNVIHGDRYTEELTYEEMLGVISALTMPKERPCLQWLQTKEGHESRRLNWSNKD
jgi:hypothetical protein